jgi:predicted PurR-regulated permease PerM
MSAPPSSHQQPDEEASRSQATLDIPNSWWRDHVHVAAWLVVIASLVLFLRYAAEVVVPLVLSILLFYALDPFVDALHRWRVPRSIGAALALATVIASVAGGAYSLRDEVVQVVAELPEGARRFRAAIRPTGEDASAMDTLRRATAEIDRAAESAAGPAPTPAGVVAVQVQEPVFRASDYLWSGSLSLVGLAGYLSLVSFLSYFLLVADDMFKRKLVRHASSTIAGKKITINVLDAIGSQIERFLLVQIVTSILVGVVTAAALWWIGLDNYAVWGLVAGVLNSIPYFGPFIVTCVLAVLAFLQFGTISMTVLVASVALVITSVEGWLITPTLLGRAAEMNRVAIFAGLLFWSWMWGVWGTLLAVPMMMVVKAVCDHVEDFKPAADFLSEAP